MDAYPSQHCIKKEIDEDPPNNHETVIGSEDTFICPTNDIKVKEEMVETSQPEEQEASTSILPSKVSQKNLQSESLCSKENLPTQDFHIRQINNEAYSSQTNSTDSNENQRNVKTSSGINSSIENTMSIVSPQIENIYLKPSNQPKTISLKRRFNRAINRNNAMDQNSKLFSLVQKESQNHIQLNSPVKEITQTTEINNMQSQDCSNVMNYSNKNVGACMKENASNDFNNSSLNKNNEDSLIVHNYGENKNTNLNIRNSKKESNRERLYFPSKPNTMIHYPSYASRHLENSGNKSKNISGTVKRNHNNEETVNFCLDEPTIKQNCSLPIDFNNKKQKLSHDGKVNERKVSKDILTRKTPLSEHSNETEMFPNFSSTLNTNNGNSSKELNNEHGHQSSSFYSSNNALNNLGKHTNLEIISDSSDGDDVELVYAINRSSPFNNCVLIDPLQLIQTHEHNQSSEKECDRGQIDSGLITISDDENPSAPSENVISSISNPSNNFPINGVFQETEKIEQTKENIQNGSDQQSNLIQATVKEEYVQFSLGDSYQNGKEINFGFPPNSIPPSDIHDHQTYQDHDSPSFQIPLESSSFGQISQKNVYNDLRDFDQQLNSSEKIFSYSNIEVLNQSCPSSNFQTRDSNTIHMMTAQCNQTSQSLSQTTQAPTEVSIINPDLNLNNAYQASLNPPDNSQLTSHSSNECSDNLVIDSDDGIEFVCKIINGFSSTSNNSSIPNNSNVYLNYRKKLEFSYVSTHDCTMFLQIVNLQNSKRIYCSPTSPITSIHGPQISESSQNVNLNKRISDISNLAQISKDENTLQNEAQKTEILTYQSSELISTKNNPLCNSNCKIFYIEMFGNQRRETDIDLNVPCCYFGKNFAFSWSPIGEDIANFMFNETLKIFPLYSNSNESCEDQKVTSTTNNGEVGHCEDTNLFLHIWSVSFDNMVENSRNFLNKSNIHQSELFDLAIDFENSDVYVRRLGISNYSADIIFNILSKLLPLPSKSQSTEGNAHTSAPVNVNLGSQIEPPQYTSLPLTEDISSSESDSNDSVILLDTPSSYEICSSLFPNNFMQTNEFKTPQYNPPISATSSSFNQQQYSYNPNEFYQYQMNINEYTSNKYDNFEYKPNNLTAVNQFVNNHNQIGYDQTGIHQISMIENPYYRGENKCITKDKSLNSSHYINSNTDLNLNMDNSRRFQHHYSGVKNIPQNEYYNISQNHAETSSNLSYMHAPNFQSKAPNYQNMHPQIKYMNQCGNDYYRQYQNNRNVYHRNTLNGQLPTAHSSTGPNQNVLGINELRNTHNSLNSNFQDNYSEQQNRNQYTNLNYSEAPMFCGSINRLRYNNKGRIHNDRPDVFSSRAPVVDNSQSIEMLQQLSQSPYMTTHLKPRESLHATAVNKYENTKNPNSLEMLKYHRSHFNKQELERRLLLQSSGNLVRESSYSKMRGLRKTHLTDTSSVLTNNHKSSSSVLETNFIQREKSFQARQHRPSNQNVASGQQIIHENVMTNNDVHNKNNSHEVVSNYNSLNQESIADSNQNQLISYFPTPSTLNQTNTAMELESPLMSFAEIATHAMNRDLYQNSMREDPQVNKEAFHNITDSVEENLNSIADTSVSATTDKSILNLKKQVDLAYTQGRYVDLFEIIKNNSFPPFLHRELQNKWLSAHYFWEKHSLPQSNGIDLDIKPNHIYRMRSTYPFPSSISTKPQETLAVHYEKNHFPDLQARQRLANDIGMSEKQVNTWFKNRRQRDRKKEVEDEQAERMTSLALADIPKIVEPPVRRRGRGRGRGRGRKRSSFE